MKKHFRFEGGYLLLRALSTISLLYSLSFIIDLLMPLQTSDDILVSRKHQKDKWHYWITENFHSPVSEDMYHKFPTGELVRVRHTPIHRTVFTISYNTGEGVLLWKRSKLYYFILLCLYLLYTVHMCP